MVHTPCLKCKFLSGSRDFYICNSIKESLPNDIALGIGVDTLPACPYYKNKNPHVVMAQAVLNEEEEIDDTAEGRNATYVELGIIIRDSYRIRQKWPTLYYITSRAHRVTSKGTLHTYLEDMIKAKKIIKLKVNESGIVNPQGRLWVYADKVMYERQKK